MEGEGFLTAGALWLRVAMVLVLVGLNAFFVAAEVALVAVRRSRIDALAAGGDARAATVQRAVGQLDRYISGTQLGITAATLALGWAGAPAVATLVDRLAGLAGFALPGAGTHTVAAIAVAFVVVAFLHVVLGELAPRAIALLEPERVSRLVAGPLALFARLMAPFLWLVNGAAIRLLALFGIRPTGSSHRVHSPEELRLLVMQARAHGTIDESDSAMLAGVFDFHHKRARDVMRPRTEVVAIDVESSLDEVRAIVRAERYSRYPVYRETLDDPVGVFLAKDLWLHEPASGEPPAALASLVREALYVPESRPAERVLEDLRRTRAHLAIVLDEYGGTAGILTLEDLVEEVIGDIADEHDQASRLAMETDGVLELAGSLSLADVRADHGLGIPEGDWSTLGGYVFSALGRLPRMGDRAPYADGELEVVAMSGRRVAAVRVHRGATPAAAGHA